MLIYNFTMYIISHPLKGNYGGMLQAYALKLTTGQIFRKACFINLDVNITRNNTSFIQKFKNCIKRVLHIIKLRSSFMLVFQEIISKFIKQQGDIVSCSNSQLKRKFYNLSQSWIVGSDQVWRASYVRPYGGIGIFFLNFLNRDLRAQSITYAASFGADEWEGTPEETEECCRLLREFKAVSVREHSGVRICKEIFGVNAIQMPDPTLLLNSSDYKKIIESEKTWLPDGKYVAAYVLDETDSKGALLQESAERLGLQLQHLMPHATAKKRRDRFPISVPQWLRLIRDCEYFITDSFHGCVFAIIYNKPFVCFGNEGRGNARFDTLLGTFGLEDRMLTNATPEKLLQVLNAPIDWERVNAIHDSERERGINFLKENLTES